MHWCAIKRLNEPIDQPFRYIETTEEDPTPSILLHAYGFSTPNDTIRRRCVLFVIRQATRANILIAREIETPQRLGLFLFFIKRNIER